MGRGIGGVRRNVSITAAAAGIVIFLVFAGACSGDLLGYIKEMIAQGECKGIIDLPRTGQTESYAAGDDGDLRKGVAWPDPRFTVGTGVETGCITDNLTGLMWEQAPSGQSAWEDALMYAYNLVLGDHSDWRLPNANELRSLVNASEPDSADWLMGQGFSDIEAASYWTSTSHVIQPDRALRVTLTIGHLVDGAKTEAWHYVLAVRSGQAGGAVSLPRTGQTTNYTSKPGEDGDLQMGVAWPSPRFTDKGNGTICDNLTGLMWEQAPSDTEINWTETLTYANNLDLGGHDDWRLPNIKELRSLINYGVIEPAAWLSTQGFSPGSVQVGYYWSSTTLPGSTTNAYHLYFHTGGVAYALKSVEHYVLAVRSGQ